MEKKDRVHLSKDAVPTIFYKHTNLGLEKLVVSYDAENHQYFGQESLELLRGKISAEDEEAITNKKQQKLDELKNLCRFCFCFDVKNESKCVSVSKLDAYQIELNEIVSSLGLSHQTSEIFGEVVCEQCFQQIVEIDLFKKKCREAQEEVFTELQELDNKIQDIRNTKSTGRVWYKSEVGISADDSQIDTNTIEILEEHLVDDPEYDEGNYQYEPQMTEHQLEANEEYIEEIHDGYKIIYQHVPERDDTIFKEITEQDMITEEALGPCQTMQIKVISDSSYNDECVEEKPVLQGVDEYEVATTDDIIKNPERNRFCFRIYECFFCKMVS